MSYEVLKIVYFIGAFPLFGKLAFFYFGVFIDFMFSQKSKWYDKRVEKPRLLFNIIAFIFVFFAFFALSDKKGEIGSDFYAMCTVFASILLFCVCIFLLIFSWSAKFRNKFIPAIEEKIKKKNSFPKIKEGLDVEKICNDVIDVKGYIDEKSRADFRLFLQGNVPQNKLIWKFTVGGKSQYKAEIFGLLNKILEGGVNDSKYSRGEYADYVCLIFKRSPKDFISDNVIKRVGEWISGQNRSS